MAQAPEIPLQQYSTAFEAQPRQPVTVGFGLAAVSFCAIPGPLVQDANGQLRPTHLVSLSLCIPDFLMRARLLEAVYTPSRN